MDPSSSSGPPSVPSIQLPQEEEQEEEDDSDEARREKVLCDAKLFLERNKYRGWEDQVNALIGSCDIPYCELLTEDSLEDSMSRIARSRSVDLSLLSREKYLSRWSRENTPVENCERYERHLRRSFTPVRDIAGHEVINDTRRPYSSFRCRTPLGAVTAPYHTNISYRSELEPIRKYDVFQLRSWSYPIYKYIYRDTHSSRPYSLTRAYATTPVYTPPQMTAECRPLTTRRGYSGYAYLATESSFDVTSRPRSTSNYSLSRPYLNVSNYFSKSYGSSSLRHFNSYRPRPYFTRIPTYYAPYY